MICFSFCGNVIAILVIPLAIITVYYKWIYQYWKRRNLPYLEPSIPLGHTNGIMRKQHDCLQMKQYYDEIKSRGWKHGGIYMILNPNYLVVDLDYLKNIMAKDFQYFDDRGLYHNEKDDPLSGHLFALGGQKWRNLRVKLTPTFTSGKVKMMFHTLMECVPNFLNKIESDCEKNIPIDIKEALGCFATDIIGSCAFGLEFDTFKKEDSPFRKYGRTFFTMSKRRLIKTLFIFTFPNLARTLGFRFIPKETADFFLGVVKDTVAYRERTGYSRNDFMQLLIDLKNKGNSLTVGEVAAQSFVFFIAGFETSSTTSTFALFELAKRPELQEKVRDEINTILDKHKGEISYDAIQEMKYMDQVINETLRKYPPVPQVTRKCTKDYKIPDQDIIIEKGTKVIVPIYAIHHDEDHWPNPERFDPGRFSDHNKGKRHPYAHIPFGEGPRLCIGMRFGIMQTKVGLTVLLKKYKFTVNKKTADPIKLKVDSVVVAAEGDIWLDAEKI